MGFTDCLWSPQGLLFSTPECLKQPQDLVKLYLHESNRVYRDKMVEEKDYGTFDKIQLEMVKKFYDVSVEVHNSDNNVHAYREKKFFGKAKFDPRSACLSLAWRAVLLMGAQEQNLCHPYPGLPLL